MHMYSPSRRLASPARWGAVSNPAAMRSVQPENEGMFEEPATPRMSGALPSSPETGSWGAGAGTSRGGQSTPRAQNSGFNSNNNGSHGDFVEDHVIDNRGAAPHRRIMNREDAVVGSNVSTVSNDMDSTWDECGLSNGKTGEAMRSAPTRTHESNYKDGGAWGDGGLRKEQPGRLGNWNEFARAHGRSTDATAGQRLPSIRDSWDTGNQAPTDEDWPVEIEARRSAIPVIPCNEGYVPAPQSFLPQHHYQPRVANPYAQSTYISPTERKLNSRINPDNYDGNRAGVDGSRVFYSAILPTVPMLQDISNHAEYTAWLDMLRSILKYHQLTSVISSDANRPSGYKDGRRWDQDRLRAAIIIKGALSFEVFERVRRNGWRDTENPAETVEKIRETHGAVCPCGHSQGMTLLDF